MTAVDLSSVLRADLGIVQANDGGAQVEAAILQCLVRTQMEIYSRAPTPWLSERNRAEVVRAPVSLPITVTQDSKAVTFGGYASWMQDCTIIISGDGAQNQLVQDGGTPICLVKPYNGPSGTVNATVYHDSIDLGSDVFRIGSPVMLDGAWELSAADTARDLQLAQPGVFTSIGPFYVTSSAGGNMGFAPGILRTQDKRILRPYAYRAARCYGYHSKQTVRLSLSSLPDSRYTIDYPAQVVPVLSNLTDVATPEYLPFSYDETIFVPWARYNFVSQPHNTMSAAALKPGFDAATAMLKGMTTQPFADSSISMVGGW